MLKCVELPTADVMANKFYRQVKHFSAIQRDVEDYDRMTDDDPRRSYDWLRRACVRALDLWRTDGHRKEYVATLKVRKPDGGGAAAKKASPAAPAQDAVKCGIFFKTGTC
eukprot:4104595-Heterocapsa_arctica.AAC.1